MKLKLWSVEISFSLITIYGEKHGVWKLVKNPDKDEGYGLYMLLIYTNHQAPQTNPLLINCYHNIICTYRFGRIEPFCFNKNGYCYQKTVRFLWNWCFLVTVLWSSHIRLGRQKPIFDERDLTSKQILLHKILHIND